MSPFSGMHVWLYIELIIYTYLLELRTIASLSLLSPTRDTDATGNSMSPEIINSLFSEEIWNNMVIKKTQIEPLKVILRNKFNNKFLSEYVKRNHDHPIFRFLYDKIVVSSAFNVTEKIYID